MRTVRPVTQSEIDNVFTIFTHAYPGIDVSSLEMQQQWRKRVLQTMRSSKVATYALFEDEEMRGIMRLFDFTMNLLSTRTLVGGVGGVAVDLLHKKEKVAADMLRFFLQHYREKGACLTALYPFRPDFYRRMGFGYGTKRNLYRLRPDSLPKGSGNLRTSFLTADHREAVQACYNRFMSRTHGLMKRLNYVWDDLFASSSLKVVGVTRQGQLTGYLIFKFEKGQAGHFLNNDILVRELVYDSTADLQALLRFLHLQADQIDQVVFYTQDEHFHFLLHDPRNDSGNLIPQVYHETNTQGVGIMYRVIDMPRLFYVLCEHNFGGATCRLKILLEDSFFPQNEGEYLIHFQDGRANMVNDGVSDVEMQLDVAEFSSLILGAISFNSLFDYGLVTLSDAGYVGVLDRLFAAPRPLCFTEF